MATEKKVTVKYIQSIAGVNWRAKPGDVADVLASEAKKLISAGIAVPVKQTKETAVQK